MLFYTVCAKLHLERCSDGGTTSSVYKRLVAGKQENTQYGRVQWSTVDKNISTTNATTTSISINTIISTMSSSIQYIIVLKNIIMLEGSRHTAEKNKGGAQTPVFALQLV